MTRLGVCLVLLGLGAPAAALGSSTAALGSSKELPYRARRRSRDALDVPGSS